MTIFISDTHFGVKQNSVTWLRSQMNFMETQLIPYIQNAGEPVVLYHLGDVFDSRSSINPMVATAVRNLFIKLGQICQVYIIAGNHDFYSPDAKDIETNSLQLVLSHIDGVHLIIDKAEIVGNDLLVPWYEFDNIESLIKKYHPFQIFVHADITQGSPKYTYLKSTGIPIYSGHIHTPQDDNNLHTLGSVYSLTFADCNGERLFYVQEDTLQKIPNTSSINFWRIRNDEILNFDTSILKDWDYVEIYADQNNLTDKTYIKEIKRITSCVKNVNVIPYKENSGETVDVTNYDIETIIANNIPDHLKSKFAIILERSQEKLD